MKDKNIIICDIDGTIANVQHRLHYIKNPDGSKKSFKDTDWDSFHKACVDDTPYDDVIEVLRSLVVGHDNREVYFFSGRNSSVRKETWRWLEAHVKETVMPSDFSPQQLQMRSENDRRPDTVVKLEIMQGLGFTPDDVLCILDDRQSVVDMWRENGFRVMQVDAWKEEGGYRQSADGSPVEDTGRGTWREELKAALKAADTDEMTRNWRQKIDPKDIH
tara:strand:+ start:1585 stop:2238 length:654 start_codon:yes stop_codon:yes gene_type:complete